MLLAMVSLSSLIAASTPGAEQPFTLSCSGTQALYREDVVDAAGTATRMSLPWARAYTIYPLSRHYCETRCRTDATLDAVDGDHLVLGDSEYGSGSKRLRFTVADGAIHGEQVRTVGDAAPVHLLTDGTCTLAVGKPTPPAPPARQAPAP